MKSRKSILFRRPTCMRCVNFLRLFAVIGFFPVVTQASIIYVDATHGEGGNTGATGQPLSDVGWVTTGSSTPDNDQWGTRTFGTGDTLYQGYLSSTNATQDDYSNFPKLTTTISGLTDGQTYKVYAFFWDSIQGEQSWSLGVGLNSPPSVTYYKSGDTAPAIGDFGTGTLSGTAILADTLEYAPGAAPQFTDGDESQFQLFAVDLGNATASGGSIDVYIAQLIETSGGGNLNDGVIATRTWYDGVGYAIMPIPEPSTAILVGLGLVGLFLWVRRKL